MTSSKYSYLSIVCTELSRSDLISLDVAQGQMNGEVNETRTHFCLFANQAC